MCQVTTSFFFPFPHTRMSHRPPRASFCDSPHTRTWSHTRVGAFLASHLASRLGVVALPLGLLGRVHSLQGELSVTDLGEIAWALAKLRIAPASSEKGAAPTFDKSGDGTTLAGDVSAAWAAADASIGARALALALRWRLCHAGPRGPSVAPIARGQAAVGVVPEVRAASLLLFLLLLLPLPLLVLLL